MSTFGDSTSNSLSEGIGYTTFNTQNFSLYQPTQRWKPKINVHSGIKAIPLTIGGTFLVTFATLCIISIILLCITMFSPIPFLSVKFAIFLVFFLVLLQENLFLQEEINQMTNNNPLEEFGKSLNSFVKSGAKKLGNLAFLNLLIIFGLFMYSTINIIGDEITSIIYTVGDIGGQLFLEKRVIREADHIPHIIYLAFILIGFLICMFFVKKDKDGKLW